MIVNRVTRPIPPLINQPDQDLGRFEQVLEQSRRNRVTKPIPDRPTAENGPLNAGDLMNVDWPVDPPQRHPILTNRAGCELPLTQSGFIASPVVKIIDPGPPPVSDPPAKALEEAVVAASRREQPAVEPDARPAASAATQVGPDNWTMARADATQSPAGQTSLEIKPAKGLEPERASKAAVRHRRADRRQALPRPRGYSRKQIERLIARTAAKHDLSPQLLRAVIEAESGFNHRAKSPVGAMGLMQLMPETARFLGVDDPYDPVQNLEAGGRYLKGLIDRYDGSIYRALAAYNWGPGNLDRRGYHNIPGQTKHFIHRVMNNAGNLS